MTYKTIMAHLGISRSNKELLRIAAELCSQFDGRLVGIAACQPVQFVYSDGYFSAEAMAACQEGLQGELLAAEAEFYETLQTTKITLEWRSSYTTEALPYCLASEARCADLIITNVATPDSFDSSRHASIGDLVMRAGRPVLVVPGSGTKLPYERIVVAWQDTREARRAAVDALPLLALAEYVTVVEIADAADVPAALVRVQDVVNWLSRHGVAATPLALRAHGANARQLEALLTEHETDLVVAGAYGHNRLREWAFGGVTDDLLHGRRCALLSH